MNSKLTSERLSYDEIIELSLSIYNELIKLDDYSATERRRKALVKRIVREIEDSETYKLAQKAHSLWEKISYYTVNFSEEGNKHYNKPPRPHISWAINIASSMDLKKQVLEHIDQKIPQYFMSSMSVAQMIEAFNIVTETKDLKATVTKYFIEKMNSYLAYVWDAK